MERDALLAHGTSYLLKDRLMNCSDYSTAWVCRSCGSLISLGFDELRNGDEPSIEGREYCRICEEKEQSDPRVQVDSASKTLERRGKRAMDVVAVPYVFRYVSLPLS